MKYYSEKLNKIFDSEEACFEAEREQQKIQEKKEAEKKDLAERRKAMAKEVEDARKEAVEANKKYTELLKKFCKEFETYHATYGYKDIQDLLDWFFKM